MGDIINKSSAESTRAGSTGVYGDASVAQSYNTGTVNLLTSTFSGVKNPRWRDQIRSHTSATTIASGSRREVVNGNPWSRREWWTAASGVGNKKSVYYRYDFANRIGFLETEGSSTVPAPANPSATTADNRAIAKLFERINQVSTSVQAGEDLGEIGQTARLLRQPMQALRNQSLSLLRGYDSALRRNSVRKIVNELSSTVLEYKFGIVPLCSTIASAIVGFQNADYLAQYYPIYATGEDKYETSGVFNKSLGTSTAQTRVVRTKSYKVVYRGEYAVTAGADRRSANDILGLRFRDIVPTFWNLLPLSWLADYATNVGTFAASYGVDWKGVRWMNRTIRESFVNDYTIISNSSGSPTYGAIPFVGPGPFTWNSTSFSRAPHDWQPEPIFEIDLELNGGRLLNLAALIGSRIPILGSLAKKAVRKHPTLEAAFAAEVGRRGERVPYPFHSNS